MKKVKNELKQKKKWKKEKLLTNIYPQNVSCTATQITVCQYCAPEITELVTNLEFPGGRRNNLRK